MADTKGKPVDDVNPEVKESEKTEEEVEEQRDVAEKEDKSFEEIGLDPRLIRALTKKGIEKPTPIQQTAIPFILVSNKDSLPFFSHYLFRVL